MTNTTKDVFDAIKGVYALSTDLVEQEAIWLDKPLQTARKRTIRLTKGDMVAVMNMGDECHLMDCTNDFGPTHVILSCWGTIYSGDLQIVCEEIGGDGMITVKL